MKYFLFLLLFMTNLTFAAVRMELVFQNSQVKQGSIEPATLILNNEGAQRIQLQKLKGQTLGEMIYIFEVSPLIRKEGGQGFEAETKVILTKIPPGESLTFKHNEEDVYVTWGSTQFLATEAQSFQYGAFSVPKRGRILYAILGLLGLGILAGLGFGFYKKRQVKQEMKRKLSILKKELLSAQDYQEIVSIWMNRDIFLKTFSHIDAAFREFEQTLFKYQFKPSQTEAEKKIVSNAYQSFVSKISGGFNGI